MIRINLLPQAKKSAKGQATVSASASSQAWVGGYLVAAVILGCVLAAVYFVLSGELDEKLARNQQLTQQNNELREKSARLDEVRGELDKSLELERVVAELNRGRLGPTRMMVELSRILSVEGGPTIDPVALDECRRLNPLCGFNRSWDPRRLWLETFTEENRDCKIAGSGRTNEDVAEFLRRLTLSEVFENVSLEKTEAVAATAETTIPLIHFELACRVRY